MNEEIDDDDVEDNTWDEEVDYGRPIDAMLTAARGASSKEAAVCAAIEALIGLGGSFGIPMGGGSTWHPTADVFRKLWETLPADRYTEVK
jgi:hypothetical protein